MCKSNGNQSQTINSQILFPFGSPEQTQKRTGWNKLILVRHKDTPPVEESGGWQRRKSVCCHRLSLQETGVNSLRDPSEAPVFQSSHKGVRRQKLTHSFAFWTHGNELASTAKEHFQGETHKKATCVDENPPWRGPLKSPMDRTGCFPGAYSDRKCDVQDVN